MGRQRCQRFGIAKVFANFDQWPLTGTGASFLLYLDRYWCVFPSIFRPVLVSLSSLLYLLIFGMQTMVGVSQLQLLVRKRLFTVLKQHTVELPLRSLLPACN
jgi:hypothetical protein